MFAPSYLFRGTGNAPLTLFLLFAVSLVCHAIFFAILIYFPIHTPYNKKFLHSVINVSMVTLPAQGSASGPAGQIELKSKIQSTRPKKAQVSKIPSKTSSDSDRSRSKTVSVAPKKGRKIKESLKKKTFKPSKVVKNAITRIEKQVEDSRPDQVIEAINRLKSKVGSSEARDIGVQGEGLTEQQGSMPGGAFTCPPALKPIDIYRVEIAYQIQKNWAFSESLAGGRTDLVVELAFSVMPGGEIKDIWFDTRSGNRYLDESAYKAVMKSNPVSPHPPGLAEKVVYVGLRFGPKGLDQKLVN
ncbi:MAG: TonB C-terminal domain-containing protein [Deltaproteobacteria bacterium]|nr:TonB C-terminal domain-containing protein [Deltaproteobacteria bacterium]